MARKRIHMVTMGDISAKVYRDSEWQEFVTRLYSHGNLIAGADYFSDDREDSIATASAMVRHATTQGIAS